MQVNVVVRGYSQETLRAFLDIASDMGLPIAEVRSTPLGLIIPIELAVKAGLIDTVPCTEVKPKRSYTKKSKPVEDVELPWDE